MEETIEPYGRPKTLDNMFNSFPIEYQNEINAFIEKLTLNRLSAGTIKQYRFYLIRLYETTNKSIKELTSDDIEEHVSKLIRVGLEGIPIKHTTQKGMYSAFNTYFNFHKRNDLRLDRRQVKGSDDVPIEIFSKKDRDQFFEKTLELYGLQWKTMFELSYWAAFRIEDLVNLKSQNIDFKNNKILIEKGKGNKDAIITLFPRAKECLQEYMNSEFFNPKQEYLFMYTYKKGPKAGKTLRYYPLLIESVFQNVLESLHIGKLMTFHTLRHSMATHLMAATKGDIARVQQHLRHKQGSTVTLRYLNLYRNGFSEEEVKSFEDDIK